MRRMYEQKLEYVRFYCEDCQIEFDVEGTVERTDNEGGIDYVPGLGADETVYCPNESVWPMGDKLPHEVSIVGVACSSRARFDTW